MTITFRMLFQSFRFFQIYELKGIMYHEFLARETNKTSLTCFITNHGYVLYHSGLKSPLVVSVPHFLRLYCDSIGWLGSESTVVLSSAWLLVQANDCESFSSSSVPFLMSLSLFELKVSSRDWQVSKHASRAIVVEFSMQLLGSSTKGPTGCFAITSLANDKFRKW